MNTLRRNSYKYRLEALWLLLNCVFFNVTAQDIPIPFVQVSNINVPSPGYLFIAPLSPDSLAIVDHTGNTVRKLKNFSSINLTVQPDGYLTYYDADAKVYLRRNENMELTDTLTATGDLMTDYHELYWLPNNSYVIIGIRMDTVDMSKIVTGGQVDATVANNVVQIRSLDGTTHFVWKSLDHIQITDATSDMDLTQKSLNPVHINSVALDRDGNYILSCRNINQVIKINSTSGAIMWRMGGSSSKKNDFTFLNDTIAGYVGFSHQHHVQRLKNGNLVMFDNGTRKPDRYSRVVEYEVDEVAKTVKKVWEYLGVGSRYAPTMGSVQELPNGRLLVGWGSSPNAVICEEIDKDLNIYCTWSALQGTQKVNTYRASKTLYLMTGFEKTISVAGLFDFSNQDSTTHIAIDVISVSTMSKAIVEKHNYLPHNYSTSSPNGCFTYPIRWTVRYTKQDAVQGNLQFNFDGSRLIPAPGSCVLFHRPVEGTGVFSVVSTTYNSQTKTITAPLLAGEYSISSKKCLNPQIVAPTIDSVTFLEEIKFVWTAAVENDGYSLELATDSTFDSVFVTKSLADTFSIIPINSGETYFWRVCANRTGETAVWVQSSFTSSLEVPSLIAPVHTPVSNAFGADQRFEWNGVRHALRYNIQISKVGSLSAVLDTTVTDASMYVVQQLPGDSDLKWRARAQKGAFLSDWSEYSACRTGPTPPVHVSPMHGEINMSSAATTVEWTGSSKSDEYRLRLISTYGITVSTLFDGVVKGSSKEFTGLPTSATIRWSLCTIGDRGTGQWSSPWTFRTTSLNVYPAAVTIAPKGPTRNSDVTFLWSKVKGASYYTLQISAKKDFGNPFFIAEGIGDTSTVVKNLPFGIPLMWRVVGLSDSGSGLWSDTAHCNSPIDSIPLFPIHPEYGDKAAKESGEFRFVESSAYSKYTVRLSTDSLFTNTFEIPTNGSPMLYSDLLPKTTYWWQVEGLRADLSADTGVKSVFTVKTSTSVDEDATQVDWTALYTDNDLVIRSKLPISNMLIYNILGQEIAASRPSDEGINELHFTDLETGILFLAVYRVGVPPSTKSIIVR